MTSLSQQLKRLALPQTKSYRQESKRASFLFDPKEAAGIDRQTFFDIGCSGFEELQTIDESFCQYKNIFFNEASIEIQRAVLSKEANDDLNNSIEKFLLQLTPYFTLRAAQKALEWLIYRFSIHQYNIDAVMRCILPYHDTNIFVRMVQILEIDENNDLWYWILPIRKNGTTLSRQTILNHCSNNLGFVNYVCEMIVKAVETLNEHELKKVQILFTFYASIICGTIGSSNNIKEAFVGQLLPNIILGLKSRIPEYNISSFMIICQLALKIKLSTEICQALIKQMFQKIRSKTLQQNLTTVVVLFQTQVIDEISSKALLKVTSNEDLHFEFLSALDNLSNKTNVDSFLTVFIHSLIKATIVEKRNAEKSTLSSFLHKLFSNVKFTPTVAQTVFECLFDNYLQCFSENDAELLTQFQTCFGECCAIMFRCHPVVFDVLIEQKRTENETSLRKFIELCDSGIHKLMDFSDTSLMLSLNHSNSRIRCLALKQLFSYAHELMQKDNSDIKEIRNLILERFSDKDWRVLKTLIESFEITSKICGLNEALLKTLDVFDMEETAVKKLRRVKLAIIDKLCALDVKTLDDSSRRKIVSLFLPKLFISRAKFCPYAKIIAESEIFHYFKLKEHLADYVNKLSETEDINATNAVLMRCLTSWIAANVDERVPFCNDIESSSRVSDNMIISSLYANLLNIDSIPTDFLNLLARHLEFCINKFQIIDEVSPTSKLPKVVTDLDDVVKIIGSFVNGSKVPRQFLLYLNWNLLNFLWKTKPASFHDLRWWPVDNSNLVVNTLARHFRLLLDGMVVNKSAEKTYAPCLESFLQTCFVNFNDLFRLSAVGFISENWENLSLSFTTLLCTMINSVNEKTFDKFLAKDSIAIPTLLIGSAHDNMQIRKLSMKCVKALHSKNDNHSSFYSDFVDFLVQYAAEIQQDSSQLQNVMTAFLKFDSNESPKKSTSKNRMAVLLSILDQYLDVSNISSMPILVSGLKILHFFNNKDVLHRCTEALKHLYAEGLEEIAKNLENNSFFSEFLSRILSKLCSEVVAEFFTLSSKFYEKLKKYLLSYQDINSTGLTLFTLNQLNSQFFGNLPENVQQDLFRTLFNIILTCSTSNAGDVCAVTKSKLSAIKIDSSLLLCYLNEVIFAEKTSQSGLSPSKKFKRKRTESGGSVETGGLVPKLSHEKLKLLIILLEVFVANENAERSDKLMPLFFTSVAAFLDLNDREVLEYGIRLCLASIESICQKLTDHKISQKIFDIELIVRCIRVAETPQTHQHAFQLLTIAASVFKEDLVIRLMPIFSFMGDNLFRQDDAYSFQVISRTIDTIIPALLSSYEAKQSQDILVKIFRDFTASAMHIPQHRRLAVLTNLAFSSEKAKNNAELPLDVPMEGENYEVRVKCKNFWILLGLLVEYHSLNWNKGQQLDTANVEYGFDAKDSSSNSALEFALRLCSNFSATDQIYCATRLLKYVMNLPDETKSFANLRNKDDLPPVFEMKNKTDKQLRHFKYEILGLVSTLLNDSNFILKLSEFTTEDFESISNLCKHLIEEIMRNLNHYSRLVLQKANDVSEKFWKAMLHRAKSCLDKFNILLPADISLNIIRLLLQSETINVKQCALEILNSKLLQNPTPFTKAHIGKLCYVLDDVTFMLNNSGSDKVLLVQCALFTLKLLARVVCVYNKDAFSEAFRRVVAIVHDWRSINKLLLCNALLCLADLVVGLGVSCLPMLSVFMKDLLEILADKNFCSDSDLLVTSCITALNKIIETVPNFLNPYLAGIIRAVGFYSNLYNGGNFKNDIQNREKSIKNALSRLPTRLLLPAVRTVLTEEGQNYTISFYSFVFNLLHENLTLATNDVVTEQIEDLTAFFMHTFDVRLNHASKSLDEIGELEDATIDAFSLLALKLSENNFRPLLTKFMEWATVDREKQDRLITLFKLANKLAQILRSLFALFAAPFIKVASELMPLCSVSKNAEKLFTDALCHEKTNILLCLFFDLVNKCCQFDTQGFINRDRFDLLIKPLVAQIENTSLKDYGNRTENHLLVCVVNLASAVNDDSAWKTLNYEILLKTRNRKSKVRITALKIIEQLYAKLGESISVLIPETVPFLAELMEDESEEVEQQCQKVIAVLEKIVGESLKDYF